MKHISLFTLLLTIPQQSLASNYQNASLDRIATTDTGTTILWSSTGRGDSAINSCSTGTGVLAFDSKTEGGKSLLSIALAAYMAGKKLVFLQVTRIVLVLSD
ncbi:hypothetical protein ACJJIG_02660 [Microbulbifer sp. SSSA007]|uniref:hypothetical protein n=1 Tax=unclassified Microbulbifer TaxID=2619833 RepID=UPI0040393C7E